MGCSGNRLSFTDIHLKENIQREEFYDNQFNEIKAMMKRYCLLTYPYPNKPYFIETFIVPDCCAIGRFLATSNSSPIYTKTRVNMERNDKKIASYWLFLREYCSHLKSRNRQNSQYDQLVRVAIYATGGHLAVPPVPIMTIRSNDRTRE